MSEYVGAYAQRLAWLTGFGDYAGTAAVLADTAAVFVDGRYTLQVREQVDGELFDYQSGSRATSVAAPLGAHARGRADRVRSVAARQAVGRCLQPRAARTGRGDGAGGGQSDRRGLADRPAPSLAPALVHGAGQAGKSSEAKRSEVADWLAAKGLDAAVVSALDGVAWLLDVRGADVDRTPVGVVVCDRSQHADGTAELFIAPEKVTPELRARTSGTR